MKKSLRVKGLDPKAPFADMARLILRDRLGRVNRASKRYLESHQDGDLYELRVAFRRLRYPLECFSDVLPRRLFDTILDRLELLQRAVGQVHDLDVMLDELRTRRNGHSPFTADSPDPATGAPEPAEAEDEPASQSDELTSADLAASLEAERQRRLEALEGALMKVLDSGAFRRLRRELRD